MGIFVKIEDFLGKFYGHIGRRAKHLDTIGKGKWRHFLIKLIFINHISDKIEEM